MRLKKAILSVMGRDVLKEAVQGLGIDDVDRRSVQKMNARLSRARRATPEYLLELLSEQDVKHVCELLSIDATGRRRTVVPRLLAAGRSPVPKRVATDPPESASKVIPSRRDSPQMVAVPKMPSNTLYTVGYGGIPEPEEMTALLSEHGVEVLVDIRVRPFGHKVLFNKKKLEDTYGPVKSAGLDYLHIVELGNEGKGTGVIRLTAVPLSAYGNGLGTLCAGMIGIVKKTNQTQEKPSPWLTIIQYSRRCSSWCRDMSSRAWHASTSRDGWPVA